MVMKLVSRWPRSYQSALGCCMTSRVSAAAAANNAVEARLPRAMCPHRLRHPRKLYSRGGRHRGCVRVRPRQLDSSSCCDLGYPGVGKSALVQEVHKGVAKAAVDDRRQFDLSSRSVPYWRCCTPSGELMRQLLSEPEEHLSKWRLLQIQRAGRPQRSGAGQLIPELEQIIGLSRQF